MAKPTIGPGFLTHVAIKPEVEEPNAGKRADDDTNAGSEVFRYVIRIVHTHCHDDAAKRLKRDGGPHNPVVPIEEAGFGDGLAIFHQHPNEEGWEEREERQLHIADPEAALSVLQHLLEVDSRQTRDDTRNDDGTEANGGVHPRVSELLVLFDAFVGGRSLAQMTDCRGRNTTTEGFQVAQRPRKVDPRVPVQKRRESGRVRARQLGDCNADGQEHERHPFPRRQAPTKNGHAKESGGEDLELICHLERGCAEIADGNVLQ